MKAVMQYFDFIYSLYREKHSCKEAKLHESVKTELTVVSYL